MQSLFPANRSLFIENICIKKEVIFEVSILLKSFGSVRIQIFLDN
jgi:hypothetical protein